ncbi:MAG: hypothetical protein ACHP7N_17265 [Caulobacterales bacterium]
MAATDKIKTSIRTRMVLATAIAAIVVAGAANAKADPVDLKVVDRDTGQVLRMWRHDGRLFVAGRPGSRYALRVTNHTDGRVLVVLSVDGVNIVSGETAGYDQRGYIYSPHESYDLTGWRKSTTEVAAFTFAPLPQSYAARTGRPADVGVIGMAVFKEKVEAPPPEPEASADLRDREDEGGRGTFGGARAAAPRAAPLALPAPVAAPAAAFKAPPPPPPPPPPPAGDTVVEELVTPSHRAAPASPSSARALGGASSARRDEKLGTAHGAREWSVSNVEPFERATPYPQFVCQIEYDTYANLVASGVIEPYENRPPHPRPFPSTPDGAGYVPDPPD